MNQKEIIAKLNQYATSCDTKDWATMSECLANEIIVAHPISAEEPPATMSKSDFIDQREIGLGRLKTSHIYSKHEIQIERHQASCKCTFQIKRFEHKGKRFYHSYGNYEFGLTYSKQDKQWKISEVIQQTEGNEGSPAIYKYSA